MKRFFDPVSTLHDQFGDIDIYLFDQLLRGRITPGMRLFDAGCGAGRNLAYFLREGYDVSAVDADPRGVDVVRRQASYLPPEQFRAEPIESSTFADAIA
ncbi:MAG TPA: methyltransferase domain-containing protein, partial [Vicinamibacterales bacterium]|nr:methyltransferase domain-containing protein [Vicinamibacterales bacterium]